MADAKYPRRDGEDPGAHYIEEAVSVYLMRHPTQDRWVIDPLTIDGGALDSTHDTYPSNVECHCGQDDAVCDTVTNRMAEQPLPSGEELMVMLADALGYQVTLAGESQ
ncbi:hypothetical protein [Gordonia sp. SMJS1]|uniref:hypothetical protein n=1 Tax=Gordonia sp. SMJS1 TaxID=3039400 RepID=UPI0024581BBE|nr:hypothetical protein [Gordonia sp. SMJS1]WGJ88292.1 hypothetical protein QAD21_25255 [Gordonia sp. SMJS1]